MRISDWSSDVCSSDLILPLPLRRQGEAGRGWSRLGLIPKAPLPNPPGHRAQLDGVRRAANQWFANGLPHPLPSQGREQSSRLPLLLHSICEHDGIGRAHVLTPVTNPHLVCRLLLDKKKKHTSKHIKITNT